MTRTEMQDTIDATCRAFTNNHAGHQVSGIGPLLGDLAQELTNAVGHKVIVMVVGGHPASVVGYPLPLDVAPEARTAEWRRGQRMYLFAAYSLAGGRADVPADKDSVRRETDRLWRMTDEEFDAEVVSVIARVKQARKR